MGVITGVLAVAGVHAKVLVEVIARRAVQVPVQEAAKQHALIVVMQMQEDGKFSRMVQGDRCNLYRLEPLELL